MKKGGFPREPKFLVDARAAELKMRQANLMNSKEGLEGRVALHLAEVKHAKQQLKKASPSEEKILLEIIANNERQARAIKKYLAKR